jgi:hypothetical protein
MRLNFESVAALVKITAPSVFHRFDGTPTSGKPTTMRTVRLGYPCASAIREMAGSAAAPAARCRNRRR